MGRSHAVVIKGVMQTTNLNYDLIMYYHEVMDMLSELVNNHGASSAAAVDVSFDMVAIIVSFEKHYVYLIKEVSNGNSIKAYKLAQKNTDYILLKSEPEVYLNEMVPAEKIIPNFDAKSYADFIRSL